MERCASGAEATPLSEESWTSRRTCVEDVSDDFLSSVFECLHSLEDRGAVALTCRRWCALEGLSRHTLRFVHQRCESQPLDEADFLYQRLMYAIGAFPHIFHIHIDRFTQLSDSFFAFFQTMRFTQLTGLHLYFCLKISDLSLNYVIGGCPGLTHLTLTLCLQITDVGLHVIAEGLPSLEYLNISYCKEVSDRGIDNVLRRCAKMREIAFSYCYKVDGWGLRNGKNLEAVHAEACVLKDACLVEGLRGALSIQVLNLADLRSGVRLTGTGLGQIGISASQMRVLCLRMCRVLDDPSVKKIAQGCPHLMVWDLCLCQEVTLEGWQAVALFCDNLQYLDVRRCRQFCDRSMLAIQESCVSLRCIHVTVSSSLTPDACRDFQVSRPDVRVDTQGPLNNCCHIT